MLFVGELSKGCWAAMWGAEEKLFWLLATVIGCYMEGPEKVEFGYDRGMFDTESRRVLIGGSGGIVCPGGGASELGQYGES